MEVPAAPGVQVRDLLLVREHDVVEVLLYERTRVSKLEFMRFPLRVDVQMSGPHAPSFL